MSSARKAAALVGGITLLTAGLTVVQATAAQAADPGDGLVLSEVYGGGGNSGATYTHDFIEIFNPTDTAIAVDGLSVQYRSSSGGGTGFTNLAGTVAPGRHYLVQEARGSGGTTPLPAPDATGGLFMSASAGSVALVRGTGTTTPTAANTVDLVGYGSAALCEGACAPGTGNTTSVSRGVERTDTDDNATDFSEGAPDPQNSASTWPPPEEPPVEATIAEIQGDGSSSPLAGEEVTTRGVVTAAYDRGGFWSFVIQTPGTGSGDDATPGRSDALWVLHECCGMDVEVGDYVEVTGPVSEEFGRTQLTYFPGGDALTVLDEQHEAVTPLATAYPTTFAEREAHESELLDVSQQAFTVSDNYSTNQYGEIGLAAGDTPLITPTEVADAQDAAAVDAVEDDNYARGVVLDDASDWDYIRGSSYVKSQPLPWLDRQTTARVGADARVVAPVILDYGFGAWRFQPTSQVNGPAPEILEVEDTRPANQQPQDVGGDLGIATFNVLNYFNTTGMDFEAAGGECSYYTDRAGDEVTNDECTPDGPRGAAEDEDLARQQAKIVAAINTLDADVVSLEEIENSVKLGENNRDDALKELVDALNADAGTTRWARVPSPPAHRLPSLADQDVIRNAFIFNPATVDLVGPSRVLLDAPEFDNAREPLAQAFTPEGRGRDAAFAVISNHFKSKGSECAEDEDDVDVPGEELQGNCNADRVAQAEALADFAADFQADRGIEKVFLAGDFNAYSMEDPIQALEAAGYTDLESDTAGEWSYSFDGMSGSLDHVLANDAALADVTGVDTWEINANEAVAYEYSRHNYNVTDLYEANVFRASDHNPELVGLSTTAGTGQNR